MKKCGENINEKTEIEEVYFLNLLVLKELNITFQFKTQRTENMIKLQVLIES